MSNMKHRGHLQSGVSDEYVLPRKATPDSPLRLAVMISGGGSGLRALLKYQQEADRAHVTTVVIADSESAGGLKHAMDAGVGILLRTPPSRTQGGREEEGPRGTDHRNHRIKGH